MKHGRRGHGHKLFPKPSELKVHGRPWSDPSPHHGHTWPLPSLFHLLFSLSLPQFQCNGWKMWCQRVVVVAVAPPLAVAAGAVALPVITVLWTGRKTVRICRNIKRRMMASKIRRIRYLEVRPVSAVAGGHCGVVAPLAATSHPRSRAPDACPAFSCRTPRDTATATTSTSTPPWLTLRPLQPPA